MFLNALTLCFINQGALDVLLPVSQIKNKYGKGCDPPEKTQYRFMLRFLKDMQQFRPVPDVLSDKPNGSVPLHPWPVTCHSQRTVHMRACVLARMTTVR